MPKPSQNEILICTTSKSLCCFEIRLKYMTAQCCMTIFFYNNSYFYNNPVAQQMFIQQIIWFLSYKWQSQLSDIAICHKAGQAQITDELFLCFMKKAMVYKPISKSLKRILQISAIIIPIRW